MTVLMRGQRALPSTTIAIARFVRFCYYLRFVSVVSNTSKPPASAAKSSSPLRSVDQPCSKNAHLRRSQSAPGRMVKYGLDLL